MTLVSHEPDFFHTDFKDDVDTGFKYSVDVPRIDRVRKVHVQRLFLLDF